MGNPVPACYVTNADCTVQGLFMRKGTLVRVFPGTPLWDAYGGQNNLTPISPTEYGDDAGHAGQGN